MTAKVATTTQLAKVIRDSSKVGYNRSYDNPQDIISKLDPNGYHILSTILVHEHINGEKVDPHYRVNAYLKLKGKEAPHEVILDVTPKLYDSLENVQVGPGGRGSGKTENNGKPAA